MNWLLIAYLLCLTFISFSPGSRGAPLGLRGAWICLAAIPFSYFFMALFRAGNFRHPQDIVLIEIWSDAFAWLFLGLSMLFVARSLTRSA